MATGTITGSHAPTGSCEKALSVAQGWELSPSPGVAGNSLTLCLGWVGIGPLIPILGNKSLVSWY